MRLLSPTTWWRNEPARPKAQASPFQAAGRPAPKPTPRRFSPPDPYEYEDPEQESGHPSRPEPTYHPISAQGRRNNTTRR